MAYALPPSRRSELEMYEKAMARPMFTSRTSASRPLSEATEMYDTDFEEDLSDVDDYAGRRSEDSFGKQSITTASTYDELRTPASHEFNQFQFQLPDKPAPMKPVEGPVGPHLFRISQDTTQGVDFYLSMSPVVSPQEPKAGPFRGQQAPVYQQQQSPEEPPMSSLPLVAWSPKQVADWMSDYGFEESIIEKFRMHDISGAILKDLQFGDLKELGVQSFGQRHRLWNEIRTLRGTILGIPPTPVEDACPSPQPSRQQSVREQLSNECSNPATPEGDQHTSAAFGRRVARRARRSDDVISPGESASIVAIEQLLPKPHHCSKGENCSRWQKQQRKLAKIAKEFPMELEQLREADASPIAVTIRPTSEAVPSVVASSDLLGPGQRPTLRLDEDVLRAVHSRDPQENVRQFLNFQHMDKPAVEEPTTPPYEMFPPLSPRRNDNLSRLPRLTIPSASDPDATLSPSRTAIRNQATPVTAMHVPDRSALNDIYRLGSPASEMDVPVTAIALGPIARDASQSVPPDMQFGGAFPISRSNSRVEPRRQGFPPIVRPQTSAPIERCRSVTSHRRQPSFAMARVQENVLSPVDARDEMTPTTLQDVNHAGWMKKRKTKMLRHEWHENHFRLNGTRLAMHRDSRDLEALESIDVDEYAVACSTFASNKLGAAFKSLKLGGKKKDADTTAFAFQLVPAAEKKGIISAATGKTHHFAVKSRDERIDWMRELMLAKALRQKADGCEVNLNGNMI
ncbi:MAG: hypothetical protein L6R40_001853 [Gallowayella cf. fulva]|nr:MAG: hypothetical protein L6R40_001853 [Xanthomendoza cf. fulva]